LYAGATVANTPIQGFWKLTACVLTGCVLSVQQYKWHEESREAIEGAFEKLLKVRDPDS
jgi:hypothetical protein